MAEILITAGADLNAKNQVTVPGAPPAAANSVLVDGQFGETPLYQAKNFKHQAMIKLLEAAGAH